jgi:hypothetical protein
VENLEKETTGVGKFLGMKDKKENQNISGGALTMSDRMVRTLVVRC